MIDKLYTILMVLFLFFAVVVFIRFYDEINEMNIASLEKEARKDMVESKKKHIDSH